MTIRALELAVAQLSPYLTEMEIDLLVDIMADLRTTRWDTNLSAGDAITQIKLVIGSDRYEEIRSHWSEANQPLLEGVGKPKWIHRTTRKVYDGLDPGDDPKDYRKLWM